MLKRTITYEDFNGDTATEIFYFNFSKPELIELEVKYDQGLSGLLKKIIETENDRELIKMFKDIVLLSYGEKSDDGRRFVKSDELREAFSQSAAYIALFMELAEDAEAAATFIKGVLPKDVVTAVDDKKPPNLELTKEKEDENIG